MLSPAGPPRHAAAGRGSGARGGERGGVIATLKSQKKISGDALLYAVGRSGNVEQLNLAAAGLDADARGRISVDAEYRTRQRHIFAVGDVIGFPSLASVSMEQGRLAAGFAVGTPVDSNPASYPYGIYTIPEISFIGKTEEQLTDEDVPYETGLAYYREIARGQIRGDTTGRLKLIFHRETKEVLGVHIIGEGAAELVHIGQAVRRVRWHDRLLREHGLQLPDAGGVLQDRGVQRPQQAVAVLAASTDSSMGRAIGVLAMEHIAVALVEDHGLVGSLRVYPDDRSAKSPLQSLPADQIAETICAQIEEVAQGQRIDAVGIGFPGIIRNGVVEESPNLPQAKGFKLESTLATLLRGDAPVRALNDADAFAAGVAATRGHLDTLIRVWTLGSGVGFGRYPSTDGVWEGGHMVVSLDPKEKYCGCGGIGHLEGIVGRRGMRQRFLDLEPEEVFANAQAGDQRCLDFVRQWHRALAAATATSVHLDGPGRFFLSGPNAALVDVRLLDRYLHEMVTMSPLQGSALELVEASDETAVIGAAVSALRAIDAAEV